jgi:predicted small metal-binding protein
MSMVITCECGHVIRGSDEQELVQEARSHIAANHPAVSDEATDADYLAMAEVHEDDAS